MDNHSSKAVKSRYKIQKHIGAGGMGTVYLADDLLTNSTVALKQVLVAADKLTFTQTDSSQEPLIALTTEFRTLSSLRHPNIISVIDYGFDEQNNPFFTMEYLPDARTLNEFAVFASFDEQVRVLCDVLQALTYLHRRGIIHRDIKPGNILIDDNEQVKVLDFGLAYDVVLPKDELTNNDSIGGTFAYMAPELFQLKPATIQTDLYAVGILAYEMFTGKHPFEGGSLTALMLNIMSSSADLDPIDARIRHVIGDLLQLNPDDRPASALDTLHAIYRATRRPIPSEPEDIRESFLQASRFVGRKQELDTLKQAIVNLTDKKASRFWLVGGESGAGKSRLVEEARTLALVEGFHVVRGQAVSDGGLPYQLWREVLRNLILEIEVTDLEAGILKSIVPDIDRLLNRRITEAPSLESKAQQQRLSVTIADLLNRQTHSLLLILEDLQWAHESLALLQQLLGLLADSPVMIIGTYRSDDVRDLPQQLPQMQLMLLERLSRTAITTLSQSMLGEVGANPNLVDLLVKETEGNIFFVVEVMRSLAEDAGRLDEIGSTTLPQSVMAGGMQQMLQRRLAKMPDWAKPTLRLAAIAGRQLNSVLLSNAIENVDIESFITVGANAAVFDQMDGNWRFAHDKLRETLLEQFDADEKARLYGLLARTIEDVYPDDATYAEQLAHYWDEAGKGEKALPYILTASDHMIRISAQYDRATDLLTRGEALVADDNLTMQSQLKKLSGDVARRTADNDAAEAAYQKSLALATDAPLLQVEALAGLTNICIRKAEYEQAEQYALRSQQLATEHNNKISLAQSYAQLGRIADANGQFTQSQNYYEQSLALEEALNNPVNRANLLLNIGVTYAEQGEMDRAESYFMRSLELQRTLGVQGDIAINLSNLGLIATMKQEYELARERIEESLKISQQINSRRGTARALFSLGEIAVAQSQYEKAIDPV